MDAVSPRDTGLLLKAFESFTQASSTLEAAFVQLQSRAQRLSEELEARNRELQRSLEQKEEVEQFLQTVLERLPCGVLALDNDGGVILCNPAAAQILGERPGGNVHRRKGRRHKCSVLRDCFASAIAPGRAGREVEVPLVRGTDTRVLATSGTPLTNASGESFGSLHIIRDVTGLKALEEQGKRGERLAAMGEMAVELAHEIRNPLGSIELFASLLEQQLLPGSDAARWAENIRLGSRSLNNIVSNMLHFANPVSPAFAQVDLHQTIREVLSLIDPILKQREVALEATLTASVPTVRGDRELLKQMTLNLVLNSMQAMPAKGTLSISTARTQRPSQGDAITLTVRDTGVGIAPQNLERIFDPFFTTNRKGTGLGLSVVHQIVERHSGSIRVASELNVGTTFTIVLACMPASSDPAGAGDAA